MHQGLSRCIRTIFAFLLITLAQALFAQNSTTSPSLQEQLEAQYPLAQITTGHGCTVSNADVATVLVVQKPGVVGVRASSYAPKCESNYKEGKLSPPGTMCKGLGEKWKNWTPFIPKGGDSIGSIPNREVISLEKGDNVYATRFELNESKGDLKLTIGYCSGDGNQATPYKGEVVFHFKTGFLRNDNVPAVEDTIAEVFAQNSNDQGENQPGLQAEGGTQDDVAGQILAHVLHGDMQYLMQRFAPNADTRPVANVARFARFQHCSDQIEVHKVSWRGTPPGYVALTSCDEGRPRLWMILDNDGKVSQIGNGGIISNSSDDQIKQRGREMVELIARGDYTKFRSNYAPVLQSQDDSALRAGLSQISREFGDFQSILDTQLDLYSDVVSMTCQYEKGNVSFEVAFGPALRIINWYVQPAGSVRHIPQEFQNLP